MDNQNFNQDSNLLRLFGLMKEPFFFLKPVYSESNEILDFIVCDFNFAAEFLTGFSKAEIVDSVFSELFENIIEPFLILLKGKTTSDLDYFEYYHKRLKKHLQVTGFLFDNDFVGCLINDISFIKKQELRYKKNTCLFNLIKEFTQSAPVLANANEVLSLLCDQLEIVAGYPLVFVHSNKIMNDTGGQFHFYFRNSEEEKQFLFLPGQDIIADFIENAVFDIREKKQAEVSSRLISLFSMYPKIKKGRFTNCGELLVIPLDIPDEVTLLICSNEDDEILIEEQKVLLDICVLAESACEQIAKAREKLLVQEEIKTFKKILENANYGLFILDEFEKITYINNYFAAIHGFEREELLTASANTLIDPAALKDFETLRNQLEKVGMAGPVEIIQNHRSGFSFPTLVSGISFTNEISNEKFTAFTALDITDMKHNYMELKNAKDALVKADSIKNILLSNMSHEFRTPMSGILGYTEILHDLLTTEDQFRIVKCLEISEQRLLKTITALLELYDLSTSDSKYRNEFVNAGFILEQVVEEYKEEIQQKQLTLSTLYSDADYIIAENDGFFKRICENLLDNAIKFTRRGNLTVKTYITGEHKNSILVLEISDTGIGMDSNNLPKIYDAFMQVSTGNSRRFEGIGLGLSIVKKMVDLMNGEINIESNSGIGTTIRVSFPAEKKAVFTRQGEKYEDLFADLFEVRKEEEIIPAVLIIEDNNYNFEIMQMFLNGICEVDGAIDCIEALRKVKNSMYNIILLDINLGTGLNGIETLREIRKVQGYEKTKIAAVTGFSLGGDREKLLDEGFDYYLRKPFKKEQFISFVRGMLGKSSEL